MSGMAKRFSPVGRAAILFRSLRARIMREKRYFALIAKLRDPKADLRLMEETVERAGGVFERHCPACGYSGFFRAFGDPPRWDAQCPSCGSLERHRHLALLLRQHRLIEQGSEILHFAPERCIEALVKPFASRHVAADLKGPGVDLALDIERIDLPDESFDIILCSHVLEHVDDRKAISELTRVLRPLGKLIVLVPIIEGIEKTYEDDKIADARQRLLHFGQHDHVRLYGRDFRDRLGAAPLDVHEYTASGREAIENGLVIGDKIFVCTKSDKKAGQ